MSFLVFLKRATRAYSYHGNEHLTTSNQINSLFIILPYFIHRELASLIFLSIPFDLPYSFGSISFILKRSQTRRRAITRYKNRVSILFYYFSIRLIYFHNSYLLNCSWLIQMFIVVTILQLNLKRSELRGEKHSTDIRYSIRQSITQYNVQQSMTSVTYGIIFIC